MTGEGGGGGGQRWGGEGEGEGGGGGGGEDMGGLTRKRGDTGEREWVGTTTGERRDYNISTADDNILKCNRFRIGHLVLLIPSSIQRLEHDWPDEARSCPGRTCGPPPGYWYLVPQPGNTFRSSTSTHGDTLLVYRISVCTM